MQDYKYFLNESKVHFDSSERVRLHTELWKPWQKLRLFDTDKAMEFLLPFYSNTGWPAKNQPQILRSFILFFLLFSEGLAKLSLTLWVDRLKHDRLLAALIGCTTDSLPPLGSYFDFMDRLWTAALLLSRGCPAFHGIRPHTKGTPYGFRRRHRRAYPCLPTRAPQGWRLSLIHI